MLYESSWGREVARLTEPNGQRSIWLTFSPDQRHLAGISYDFKNLFVWDLHEIERRLKEMGVPWMWPSPPRLRETNRTQFALKLATRIESPSQALERDLAEVMKQLGSRPQDEALHSRCGWLLSELDRYDEAIDALSQAIALAANANTFSLASVCVCRGEQLSASHHGRSDGALRDRAARPAPGTIL